jgi:hypothetical protein
MGVGIMKTIDILALDSVTGGRSPMGIVSPCFSLSQKKLLSATSDDIAQAKVSCGLKLPTAKQIKAARDRRF